MIRLSNAKAKGHFMSLKAAFNLSVNHVIVLSLWLYVFMGFRPIVSGICTALVEVLDMTYSFHAHHTSAFIRSHTLRS